MTIKELIEKIKNKEPKIEIIIILENKKEELENFLFSKKIFNILYNNKTEIKEIINLINRNNYKDNKKLELNEELKNEIKYLKNIILENQKQEKNKLLNNKLKETLLKKLKGKLNKKSNKIINEKLEKTNKKEIISITGSSGTGKSIISINLAKALIYKNEKILIIDFDILNNSLHTILGVKKYSKKIKENIKKSKKQNIKIKDLIIKINKNIDLISAINLIFNQNKKIDTIKLEEILKELQKIYSTIIIDTSSECFFDFTKTIIKLSNKNIFVTESNLSEINKSRNLLNIYINQWKIQKNKINILFNKYNKNSIDLELLKKIFSEFNIIGVLKYNENYEKLINKNIKNNFIDKEMKNEYLDIGNKI